MSARVEVLQKQLAPYNKIESAYVAEMKQTVAKMTAPGKGLLAADESVGSVAKRFAGINLPNTAENRRQYRLLFLGAENIEKYISGVIFHEETLTQKMDDGKSFPEYLNSIGIVPGIKTDQGLAPLLIGAPGEEMTQGLDNYLKRAQGFYKKGARFCKWRNTYKIQNGTISEAQVQFNAQTLARYAALSQIAGLVPIVEPEVMIDGNHTFEQSLACSQRVWSAVAAALHQHGVILECMLLKPNMIVPGGNNQPSYSSGEDRQHNHVGNVVEVPGTPVDYIGVGGCCNAGPSQFVADLAISGNTDNSSSNLPYVQLLTCQSTDFTFNLTLPSGALVFSSEKCPPGWEIDLDLAGRFLVSLPENGQPGAYFGGRSISPNLAVDPVHTHAFNATIQFPPVGIELAEGCCSGNYFGSGEGLVLGRSTNADVDVPFTMFPLCRQSSDRKNKEALARSVVRPNALKHKIKMNNNNKKH